MTPQMYTLTRIPHAPADGSAPWEPEILETYVDGENGEPWTGAYLQHKVGDQQVVAARIARVVMGDRGLSQHYRCDPPVLIMIDEQHAMATGGPAPDGFSTTLVDPDTDLSGASIREIASQD